MIFQHEVKIKYQNNVGISIGLLYKSNHLKILIIIYLNYKLKIV